MISCYIFCVAAVAAHRRHPGPLYSVLLAQSGDDRGSRDHPAADPEKRRPRRVSASVCHARHLSAWRMSTICSRYRGSGRTVVRPSKYRQPCAGRKARPQAAASLGHSHKSAGPPYSRVSHRYRTPGRDYGTRSLRPTKRWITNKATGNQRAVQIQLGHAKIESMVRYLGVDVEDALELSERTEG